MMFYYCILVVKISLFRFETLAESGFTLDFFNVKAIILAAALLIFTRYVKFTKSFHPIVFILASAVVGILFSF